MASEAAPDAGVVSSSRNGSTAVEFSGQTTKSGRWASPGRDIVGEVDGQVDVVPGDLAEVEQES